MPRGHVLTEFQRHGLLAGVVALLGLLTFAVATQPSLTAALAHRAAEANGVREHGVSWTMTHPNDLIGGAPVGVRGWRFGTGSLAIEPGDTPIYVPLNFRGRRLPSSLDTLELRYSSSRPARLTLYFRSELNGPAMRSSWLLLSPDQTQISFDLSQLDWTQGDLSARWGARSNTLATLRIHPENAQSTLHLEQARLYASGTSPSAGEPEAARIEDPVLRSAHVRSIIAAQDQTGSLNTAQRFGLQPPDARLASVVAIGALILLVLCIFQSAAAALVLFAVLVWLALSPVVWNGWTATMAAAALLILAVASLSSRTGAPHFRWAGWWIVLAGIGLMMIARDAQWPAARPMVIYLFWASVQQALLCRVLWPMAQKAGAPPGLAAVVAALLFGWAHLPNLELMIMTFLLGLACIAHFYRYRSLPPLILFHFTAGLALMATTPNTLIYSMSTGPSFWT